ncbi:glycosyltransferase [Paenibacillus sp. BK720]|uniref:glycosyltransferase n=1 Tax=Paenibacillus sp. BK720 TaxID=2587092 RepID=UPI00141DADDA|nr:glycosyltransferase [Paenibacillus sp. BK720]NIK69241.1 hypothetical protein [Paenibacillus sp. BK720]
MITIAYYISSYGYGHATRSVAVLREMLSDHSKGYKIIICSSNNLLTFLKASLKFFNDNIEYRECLPDLGYILQKGSIEADILEFRKEYNDYIDSIDRYLTREVDFLVTHQVGLVISDISPIAFKAAVRANIKSIGVSNFTWYTAYSAMLSEEELQPLYRAYSAMNYYVELAGAKEPNWGRDGSYNSGFFCRSIDKELVLDIQQRLNPNKQRTVVYFGIGMSINLEELQKMPLWNDSSTIFIVSSNMQVTGDNIEVISESYTESQHYVAAADLVITKPGWSTVAEAYVFNKPLILLQRDFINEDLNTIQALSNVHHHRIIKWEEMQTRSSKSLMKGIHLGETRGHDRINEAVNIAAYIEEIVRSERE